MLRRIFWLLVLAGIALAAPIAYVSEEVEYEFFPTGAISSGSGQGFVEVFVPEGDSLFGIKLELSSASYTNLVSPLAYRAVAASPNGARARIYVNTSKSEEDVAYNITEEGQAIVRMQLNYANFDGGQDLHPGLNFILFNLTLNASRDMDDVQLTISANTEDEDAINFTEPHATVYDTIYRTDSDLDGFYETLYRDGGLSEGTPVVV